jgi:hypothetical protein
MVADPLDDVGPDEAVATRSPLGPPVLGLHRSSLEEVSGRHDPLGGQPLDRLDQRPGRELAARMHAQHRPGQPRGAIGGYPIHEPPEGVVVDAAGQSQRRRPSTDPLAPRFARARVVLGGAAGLAFHVVVDRRRGGVDHRDVQHGRTMGRPARSNTHSGRQQPMRIADTSLCGGEQPFIGSAATGREARSAWGVGTARTWRSVHEGSGWELGTVEAY